MKRCSRCHAERPFDAFHKDRTRPSGFSAICKVCAAERDKARNWKRKWTEADNEKLRARRALKPKNGPMAIRRATHAQHFLAGNQVCGNCKVVLPTTDFHKDASRARGLSWICKVCAREKFSKLWGGNAGNYRARQKERYRRESEKLSDCYVRQRVAAKTKLSPGDVPAELVELKRLQMSIERELEAINEKHS